MNKNIYKKSKEELQYYLMFKRRGYSVKPKKGKKSYNRKRIKKEELKNEIY